MKKLLYSLPLLLIGLSLAGISLHNDTVNPDYGSSLTSLKPSHWKLKDYEVNAKVDLSQPNSSVSKNPSYEPYSQGAKFYGFPFGFYFSKSTGSGNSTFSVSAYSWLWGAVDGLLLILTLLVGFYFNRPRKDMSPIDLQSAAPAPIYPPYQNTSSEVPPEDHPYNQNVL